MFLLLFIISCSNKDKINQNSVHLSEIFICMEKNEIIQGEIENS